MMNKKKLALIGITSVLALSATTLVAFNGKIDLLSADSSASARSIVMRGYTELPEGWVNDTALNDYGDGFKYPNRFIVLTNGGNPISFSSRGCRYTGGQDYFSYLRVWNEGPVAVRNEQSYPFAALTSVSFTFVIDTSAQNYVSGKFAFMSLYVKDEWNDEWSLADDSILISEEETTVTWELNNEHYLMYEVSTTFSSSFYVEIINWTINYNC